VIADDSGLSVAALGGAPGVYSATYSGEGDEENNRLLLCNMEGLCDRSAVFVCVIALAKNGRVEAFFKGECIGGIGYAPKGKNGFGYDPLFIPQGYDVSMAEMASGEKNAISHRRNALKKLADYLKKM
jgi:XTP/dITP diphosphohydrolase